MLKYDFRISQEEKKNIIENIKEIEKLDKVSFNLSIDTIVILINSFSVISPSFPNDWKGELMKIHYGFLMKNINAYFSLLSSNNRIGAMILSRTIIENIIKMKYYLNINSEKAYINTKKNSIVNDNIYLQKLKNIDRTHITKEFIKRTEDSLHKTRRESNLDDIESLSKNKSKLPTIEEMVVHLSEQQLIDRNIYDIAYRSLINYSHANYTALIKEKDLSDTSGIDYRVIIPITIMIINASIYIYRDQLDISVNEKFLDTILENYELLVELNKESILRINKSTQ